MVARRVSLNALRAFEATARHCSFSAAAEELAVTHGAVSRQVRMLEETFGISLLRRTAQGAEPTPEGQRLAAGLKRGFDEIQSSVDQLKPGPLTLACSTSIMMYWVLPRLSNFQQKNPDVLLQYHMTSGPLDFTRDKVSVAIRLSSQEPPRDVIRTDICSEWVGPVCSPEYLRTLELRTTTDLQRARLIYSHTRERAWLEWKECYAPEIGELILDEGFPHFYLLIQAARCGLGIANVPRMLVQDDLNSGTLVAPFGFVAGPNRLTIWVASHLTGRSETKRLIDWLSGELRADERQNRAMA
ncbi:LysR family transcriptional regulator (plasmid) [Cupriavidus sp. KK10]|jgi:DNA-binding transcriptional LysR family regulator|uniref:LysR substrate-binding domain-containing protein n=1 Tax=Cupriavidus sp. KK10 TaxID=1478019 RepID=UPI001BA94890|nr:LysR substrate-binding domain-containing protein [Cupriavidus sp. KK10]QUN32121.1 LysR family transcriptional regulator [Cupriavidus sp. KK10]